MFHTSVPRFSVLPLPGQPKIQASLLCSVGLDKLVSATKIQFRRNSPPPFAVPNPYQSQQCPHTNKSDTLTNILACAEQETKPKRFEFRRFPRTRTNGGKPILPPRLPKVGGLRLRTLSFNNPYLGCRVPDGLPEGGTNDDGRCVWSTETCVQDGAQSGE